MKFGIQYAHLHHKIFIGRLNKAQNRFLDGKEDQTGEAIVAVAQWLEARDDGEPYEIFLKNGVGYRLTVERIEGTPDLS